jgi:hypothetical protein
MNLHGQLPSGSNDQSARTGPPRLQKTLEDGQRKGRRFSSAGLGKAQHVTSGEGGWDGLRLDGSWFDESKQSNSTLDIAPQTKLREPGL